MSGVPPERWEWVDQFIRAISRSYVPRREQPRTDALKVLTQAELNRLEFLRYRLEHGK